MSVNKQKWKVTVGAESGPNNFTLCHNIKAIKNFILGSFGTNGSSRVRHDDDKVENKSKLETYVGDSYQMSWPLNGLHCRLINKNLQMFIKTIVYR